MTLPDDALVVLIAVAAPAAVGLVGTIVHRAVRTRSLATCLVVVALVGVGAVLAGAVATSQVMFRSAHDIRVLLLVVAVAGGVAAAAAVLISRPLVHSGRALAAAARTVGVGTYRPVPLGLPRELAAVDAALGAASAHLVAGRDRERVLEASRRELVAGLSHDLRTPLAGIRAMSEALEDGVADTADVVHRYHRTIRMEADRLSVMVDDLFELSGISSAALRLHLQPVQITDLVSDALASAGPGAAARSVQLSAAATGDLPLVSADPVQLGRVLANVLSNALRHTPPGAAVRVDATADDGHVVVRVADGCGGIPDEDLPRVFDVAFRGTSARTPSAGGAGLGLAIARGLVQAHGGHISIANAGAGCQVDIRLPVLR